MQGSGRQPLEARVEFAFVLGNANIRQDWTLHLLWRQDLVRLDTRNRLCYR